METGCDFWSFLVTLSPSSIRLTDSLTHSPTHRMPLPIQTAAVPPPCQCCRCVAVAVGAPCVARARSRLSAARSSPPLKRERAECSPLSKLITRAALSAPTESPRTRTASLSPSQVYHRVAVRSFTQSNPSSSTTCHKKCCRKVCVKSQCKRRKNEVVGSPATRWAKKEKTEVSEPHLRSPQEQKLKMDTPRP